ncbi:unnamed protein product [Porites evermanni]|uniref:Uncharacterized protein n=1 Tax=Porites evermanni TaxID=104178 RepID=A0ABN8MF50_9CNID|nr:unnamed protein product [Porites evermanni]
MIHYSFYFAQQIHIPSDPMQPGLIYFKTPRKCGIFGVMSEAIPRQVNYLIDETNGVDKGANTTVSYVHHYLQNCELGETQQSYSQDTESSCIYLTADGTSICENDSDLLTIDEDALSRMQELFPVSPVVPPTEPLQPALINNSSTPVTEDLRETRQSGTDLYKCAINLLPNFFTPAELAMSNTDGNFGKQLLDKTKLHTLKVLIFTTFPVGPEDMQNKCQVSVEEI